MRRAVSQRERTLIGVIALTAATATVAFAVAIFLFFEDWRFGAIALAVSLVSAAATVVCFMLYRTERERSFNTPRQIDGAENMTTIFSSGDFEKLERAATSQSEREGQASEKEGQTPTDEEAQCGDTAGKTSDVNDGSQSDFNEGSRQENAEGQKEFTTLECRPPVYFMSVAEAKAAQKKFEREHAARGGDPGESAKTENDR